MSNIQKNLSDLNQLVLHGRGLEAFEKYYDDDVIMQENEETPTVGKEANRAREINFFSNMQEFRKAEVLQMATGEGISFVMWRYDYTHAALGVRNYTQVSVQHWKDDKIIREQFFYNS